MEEGKEEEEEKTEETEEKVEEKDGGEEGGEADGWGGWGNWISNSVAVATEISAKVSTVVANSVENVATSVIEFASDEPYNMGDEGVKEGSREESVGEEGVVEGEEKLLDTLDRYFESSVSGLGSLVNIAEEKARHTLDQVSSGSNLKQATKRAADKGIAVGESIAEMSVSALEGVGKTALEFLTVKMPDDEDERADHPSPGSRLRPIVPITMTTLPSKDDGEPDDGGEDNPLDRDWFDHFEGRSFLRDLENLSIECTIKVQKHRQRISPDSLPEVSALLDALEKIFESSLLTTTTPRETAAKKEGGEPEEEKEEEEEAPKSPSPPPTSSPDPGSEFNLLDESLKVKRNSLVQLLRLANADSSTFCSTFALQVASLEQQKQKEEQAQPDEDSEVSLLTCAALDEILLEGIEKVNQHCAGCVSMILELARVALDKTNEEAELDRKKLSEFLLNSASTYRSEGASLANVFSSRMKAVSLEAKAASPVTSGPETRKNEMALIDSRTASRLNKMALESSNTGANLHDAHCFLFPVCKWIVVSSVSIPSGNTEQK